jgi:hypothetical protein
VDPNWNHLWATFFQVAATALPWIIGGIVLLGVWSFSPFGRALERHLRDSRRDVALTEAMLHELSELRRTLSEVVERLDTTEQELNRVRVFAPRNAGGLPPTATSEPRIPTPH